MTKTPVSDKEQTPVGDNEKSSALSMTPKSGDISGKEKSPAPPSTPTTTVSSQKKSAAPSFSQPTLNVKRLSTVLISKPASVIEDAKAADQPMDIADDDCQIVECILKVSLYFFVVWYSIYAVLISILMVTVLSWSVKKCINCTFSLWLLLGA